MKQVTRFMVLAWAGAEVLLAGVLWADFARNSAQVLAVHRSELETGLRSVLSGYETLVGMVRDQLRDDARLEALLQEANRAQGEERELVRGRVYRALYPTYARLQARDVRVLQLVLEDGTSFLRLNRPDLYGDDIARDRPLLAHVLATGTPGSAFEHGRVYPGFRYAFPVSAAGERLGVLDFSVSFEAVRRVLRQQYEGESVEVQFILRRDLLQAVGHPSAESLFVGAPLHPDYVREDPSSDLRDLHAPVASAPWVEEVARRAGADPRLRAAMDRGAAHVQHVCAPGAGCHALILHPITDKAGRTAAYMVGYLQEPGYQALLLTRILGFGVGSLFLLASALALHRWAASRQQLHTISAHMGEGLYVMNREGRITFVNEAACALLGYRRDELMHGRAHERFHFGCDGEAAQQCAIRAHALSGETYVNDQEAFQRRDGTRLPVAVTSSPLRQDGKVTGAVVLFRDLRQEEATRMRLRLADTAFNHLGEAVMVTDADGRVTAVNPAFCAITGYREEEVLGRNPRLLRSGRHGAAFYAALWRSLEEEDFWEGEIWNRRKSGDLYPEWLKITTVRDAGGAVTHFVAVFSDITDAHRNQRRLQELAYHDRLTGLYNRAAFHELLARALARSRSGRSRLALIYLDLDRFKRVNDTLGHGAGDELLKQVAGRLQSTLREGDVVARIGGTSSSCCSRRSPAPRRPPAWRRSCSRPWTAPSRWPGAPCMPGPAPASACSRRTATRRTPS